MGPVAGPLTRWLIAQGHAVEDHGVAVLTLEVGDGSDPDVAEAYAAAYAHTLREAGVEVTES